jgi:diguanylate cyclase (GGDEF)-like protein/PAS domain S-box-containing protein
MAAMADPVVVMGPGIDLIWANHAAEERFGWPLEELRGRTLDGLIHPDDHETAVQSMASVVTKDVGTLVEIRIQDSTGDYSWFEVRGKVWPDGPHPGSVVLNLRPTTERRRWELDGGDSQLLATLLDTAPVILVALAHDLTIGGANRALTRTLHRPIEGLLRRPLTDLVHEADRAKVAAELAALAGTDGTAHFEARLLCGDGGSIPMSLAVVDLLSDRAVKGMLLAASDISALVEARSALHHLANHDELTGLPNRTSLRNRLERLLDRSPRPASTLLFGDVDGLKPINDLHGHRAGDAALSEIAARLRSITRDDDYVARLSGDEFVMLIATTDEDVIHSVEQRICTAMAEPITLPDGNKVTMTISTGVASTAEESVTADDLLAAADAAMYLAKRRRTTPDR